MSAQGCLCKKLALVVLLLACGCVRQRSEPQSTTKQSRQTEADASLRDRINASAHVAARGYVGSEACVDCHDGIAEQYALHSMGRSIAPITSESHPSLHGNLANFEADGFRYSIRRDGDTWLHRQARLTSNGGETAVIELPARYVVGSGNRGQSFLIDRDGYLFLSPITSYPAKELWHLSPGFETNNSQFNRPVVESCLFCHADRALPVVGTLNRYERPAFLGHTIGCERCHGPGQNHVSKRQDDVAIADSDPTIVNPARLAPHLRDAICQQCHMSGVARVQKPGKSFFDYLPGEPLESTFVVFTVGAEQGQTQRFVGHVEQMHESRCFQASDGAMGCHSCHDPHRLPDATKKIAYYRSRCLECHEHQPCTADVTLRSATIPEDDCMTCHMPDLETEIQHAASTDHTVRRSLEVRPSREPEVRLGNKYPIIPFPPSTPGVTERDLAIALVQASAAHQEFLRGDFAKHAINALEVAVQRQTEDLEALESLSELYLGTDQVEKAGETCLNILRIFPKHEQTLAQFASILQQVGDFGSAILYWRQAIQANPWISRYWYGLAQSYASTAQWQLCQQTTQEAVRRFPTSVGARQLLLESQLQMGDKQAGAATFRDLEAFQPRGLEAIRNWYKAHPLR